MKKNILLLFLLRSSRVNISNYRKSRFASQNLRNRDFCINLNLKPPNTNYNIMYLKSKAIVVALFGMLAAGSVQAQKPTNELTIEKIMRDPKWIGTSPSNVFW